MSRKTSRAVSASLQRSQAWTQLKVTDRDRQSVVDYAAPLMNPSEATEILFITPVEQKLWEELVGILPLSLWKVKAQGGIKGESRVIFFSGSLETVLRAKEAISKLLIMVGSGIRVHISNLLQPAGFFHLYKGLDLFLWKGETSRFRVDAVMRINGQENMDCGNAVFAHRVLDHQGSLHTNLDLHLLYLTTVELTAGTVTLALEAASKKGYQSLLMTSSDNSFLIDHAEAIAIGLDVFKKDHLASPLRSIHLVSSDGRALALFHKECKKRWALGRKDQVWLRNVLLSLGEAKVEVVTSSGTMKKTDVAVIPLGLDSDLLQWGPEVVAITQKVLETIPQAADLLPGEILPVTALAIPEFVSKTVYLIRLEGSQFQPKDGYERAIRKMVWSCLSDVYGSFLESISFPIIKPAGPDQAVDGKWLLIMLEEINRFLKELPNTWIKLVQVVPFPGQTLQCRAEDYLTNTLEPVGLCCPEEPLFLRYLKDNSGALNDFEVEMKKVGYAIRIYSPWRVMMFQATSQPGLLYDLLAAFQSAREKYVFHCETRAEVLGALFEVQAFAKMFRSIRIYVQDKMWSVGLLDEMASFLQCLNQIASQRQLVSWECSAEPLPRCIIVKDLVFQELPAFKSLVKIEILTEMPAMVRFSGRRQEVEEVERCFCELQCRFQVAPVPLTSPQSQFIKLRWGKFFCSNFFLERNIPAVLEISDVVQVAGLDLDVMKKAKELLLKEVCERMVEIPVEVKWSTECKEWRSLLQRLRSQDEVDLHHTPLGQLCVVGLYPHVALVEDSIKEYLRDNSPMEEKMSLVKPGLTLVVEELLCVMDWRHLKVNVKPESCGQDLQLKVGGLRKHVREAVPVIRMDLNDLVSDTIPLRKKVLRKYFSGAGASLVKDMAQKLHCIARMQKSGTCVESWEKRFDKIHSGVIYAVGKRNQVVSLKQAMADFIAKFHEESICNEAIGTFSDRILNNLCRSTAHKFPVSLRHLQKNELQILGSQEDVANILEAVRAEIVKYHAESIVVKAQYQKVPYVIVKGYLDQGMLPTDPQVSTVIHTVNPATVIFDGPQQKVKQLQGCFEEMFDNYQVLSIQLTDLQLQFIKAQQDKLFDKTFFLERGVLAVLEISDVVQVAGLDLNIMKEAEEIILGHVCEKSVEIPEEVKWTIESEEWREMLDRLKSQDETTVSLTSSGQVAVVGISSYVTQVVASIEEFLKDRFSVEENVIIDRSELALAGEKLLHVMDWNDLKVNIQVMPNDQALTLQVSGLQKFVREAVQVIKEDIAHLLFATVLVKKVALGEYFSGTGANVFQEMAQEKGCVAWIQHQKTLGLWNSVIGSNGDAKQELAEDHWGLICVVGTKNNIEAFKDNVNDFASTFHEETICNAEISAFGDDTFAELCEKTPHQFPVAVRSLREKVVRICGYQEDVENILGAVYAKIEEVGLGKLQESQAQWIKAKLLYDVVRWHHMTDVGWSTFDMNTNRSLETAYSQKMFKTQVPWDGQKLEVNFLQSQAFIPDTGRTIRIRREICLWEKNFAPHWEAMDGSLVKKVELQANSEEYEDVVKNFLRTANNYTVLKVERIQNQYVWVSYCWKRSCMEKKNPEGMQNERILYHGTQPDNRHSIHEMGFKSACRKEGLYGQGIYFAVNAIRSIFYAKPDSQGHRYIFQARVLTGEYVRGDENMALPPEKQEGSGRYDSLVDIPMKPTLFVTFFDDHAYPEYLITVCDRKEE